jgi:hypothetical protein
VPIRLCNERVCGNQATARGKRDEHRMAYERDRSADRRARQSFYASKRWRMTRKRHLSLHPLCEYMVDGAPCNEIATVVHHRVDLAASGAPCDHENLMSLCKPHHDSITRRRQRTG